MLQEGKHQWNITTNASGLFQDGIGGYDWSFQVEEGITNFALMPIHPKYDDLNHSVYKTKVSEAETSISKTSKDIVENPKTVRSSAPIIEEWDTDSDNDNVFRPKSDLTKPKFTKINFVKFGKNVKSVNKENTHRQVECPRKSQSPRDNRRNCNRMMTQKLGNGFESIKKACFVYGSLNYLIKDCDFHENKMVEKPVLNNKGRVTAVATKSGQVSVNAAKQSSPRATALISTAKHVNSVALKPKVNDALPTTYSYFKGPFTINTVRVNNVTTTRPKAAVSTAEGNGEMLLSPQHAGFGDQQEMLLTIPLKTVDHTCLKDLTMLIYKADSRIFDSGCSRHMTGNKSFLTDYQEIDDGFVAFGGSLKGGKITGKGKIRTGKLDFEDVYFV
ncbi:hypothetical protein Tco_0268486 [Tanacetum coccineum]